MSRTNQTLIHMKYVCSIYVCWSKISGFFFSLQFNSKNVVQNHLRQSSNVVSGHMLVPSKHFLFYKTSLRGLEDVFSGTTFCLPRRPQDLFAISLPKTSPRRLQDVFARRFQDVFKTCLQDVFFKTSSRRLQDIFKKTSCNCALKTF